MLPPPKLSVRYVNDYLALSDRVRFSLGVPDSCQSTKYNTGPREKAMKETVGSFCHRHSVIRDKVDAAVSMNILQTSMDIHWKCLQAYFVCVWGMGIGEKGIQGDEGENGLPHVSVSVYVSIKCSVCYRLHVLELKCSWTLRVTQGEAGLVAWDVFLEDMLPFVYSIEHQIHYDCDCM